MKFLSTILALAIAFTTLPTALAEDPALSFSDATGLSQSAQQLQQGYCPNCSLTQSNGTLNYSYGLELPAGRKGIQPSIALNYSQLNTSPDTLLAQGWSVNYGGSIRRTTNEGSDDMYERNEFSVSVGGKNGKLLPVDLSDDKHGTYGLETEEGFWKYEFLTDESWRVTDTRGTVYTFGSTSTTRQDDPSDATRIYKWMLERVTDTNGNHMTYEYYKDSGQIYPKKINYTGYEADDGKYQVRFEPFASGSLTAQSDAVTSYRTGFLVTTKYRLSSIQIVVAGELGGHAQKAYTFSRSQRPDSKMQNLTDIQELYWDGGSWQELPRITFDYEEQGSGWTESGGSEIWGNGFGYEHIGADINNDGFQDFIYQSSSSSSVSINQGGTGFENQSPNNFSWPNSDVNHGSQPRVADINNDGFADFIRYSSGNTNIYINNGVDGWEEGSGYWDVPNDFDYFGFKSLDVNVDGLTDWVNFNGATRTVYLNNGVNGWTRDDDSNISLGTSDQVLMDINNDGLQDLIYNANGTLHVFLHDGMSSWVDSSSETWHVPLVRRTDAPRVADVNNDGLSDFIEYSTGGMGGTPSASIYLHNGVNGWEYAGDQTDWDVPGDFEYFAYKQVDVDNDGYQDFINAGSGNHPVYLNSGGAPFLLKKISNGRGGETRISYQNAKSFQQPDGSWSNPKLRRDMLLVRSVDKFDRGRAQDETTYDYSGGEYILDDDPYSRAFAGFHTVRTTDADGNYTIAYYHQGGGVDGSVQGEFDDQLSKRGKPYRNETYDADGQLFAAEIFKYSSLALGNERHTPRLERKVSLLYDGGANARATATEFTYDVFGNVVTATDFGEVTVTDATGNFTDVGNDKIFSTNEYVQHTGNHLLSLPRRTETRDQGNVVIAETKLHYDGLPYGIIELGNVTKQEQRYDAANFASTQISYDAHGLPISSTNPRGYTTTTGYDVAHLFPETITNAKGHTTTMAYDYLTSVPILVTDANGAQTQTTLDTFGRVSEVQVSSPETGALVTQLTKSYDLDNVPNGVTTTSYTGTAEIVSRDYFDGFERVIQSRSEAEDNQFTVTNITYDKRGQVAQEYLPFFQSGLDFTPIPSNLPATAYTYDVLGRVLAATNILGTTMTQYDLWKNYVTDALGNRKDFHSDARGRLIEVREYLDSQVYATYYGYDSSGNLVATTDAEGNVQNRSYDLLGRLKIDELLHAPDASTIPKTLYSYDVSGNLIQKTNPKGQVTRFTYDELDRVTSENYTGATGTEVSYNYDMGDNALGRLSDVSYTDGGLVFEYDALGRVSTESRTIAGQIYTTAYAYNRAGQVTSIAYPDSLIVGYTYDAAGQLSEISQAGQTVLADLDFNPLGAPMRIEYGNGVTTTNTYDLNQLYRLANKQTFNGATSLQDISYTYDAIGNVTQLTDSSATNAAKTAAYTYDDLYRLTGTTVTQAANGDNYSRAYTYGSTGNMLSRSDVGSYTYSTAHPQAVSDVAGVSYSYDDAGNLTSNGAFTHTWDYRDRLKNSTDGTTNIAYSYDHTTQRTQKEDLDTGAQTLYINKYFEISDGELKHYIYAGNTKVATATELPDYPACSLPAEGEWTPTASCTFTGSALAETTVPIRLVPDTRVIPYAGNLLILTGEDISASSLIYHHSDHLTGANVDTDSAGNILELIDYYPYGDTRLDEQSGDYENSHKFTGQELDSETGLYYYGARYYDSSIGRFVSVDPWGGDITDPQSLNKYSYVQNNPVKYIDPTGEERLTVIIELPSPNSTSKLGRKGMTGHTGIAVGNEYYDYGPKDGKGTSLIGYKGQPWWDTMPKFSEFGDADLDDILNNNEKIHNPAYSVTAEITSEQAEIITNYWEDRYAELGTYRFYDDQCTTTVRDSLREAGLIDDQIGVEDLFSFFRSPVGYYLFDRKYDGATPQGLLKNLTSELRSTYGPDEGKLAQVERINPDNNEE
jgi:RHS repeat-associated protein